MASNVSMTSSTGNKTASKLGHLPGEPCPRGCDDILELRGACCAWRNNGWEMVLRCFECNYVEGFY